MRRRFPLHLVPALLAAVTGVLAPRTARAQLPPPVPAAPSIATGTRLRVTLDDDPARTGALTGRLLGSGDLHLVLDTRSRQWTLPWSQVRGVEVGERRSAWDAAARGAGVGALIGASIAVMTPSFGGALVDGWSSGYDDERPPSRGAASAATIASGAAVGLVVGLLLDRERWTAIALPGR